MKQQTEKRMFMKPGRTNQEDRDNFIKFWVAYMKTALDTEWSAQQNVLINSRGANHEVYLRLKGLHKSLSRLEQPK